MKLIEHVHDKIVLEFTDKEFDVISQVLSSVRQEHEILDPVILDTPYEAIEEVDERFMDMLSELNERRARK